jgi:transcriptional regulator with XRE-family HTH domain
MSTAGQRVKEVRKRRGLSQRELANASGVSLSTIRKLEQGERETARLETLRKLAHVLRVSTMSLGGGRNPEDPDAETVDRWKTVRNALERPPIVLGFDDEPPTVDGLRATLSETEPLFKGDQFAALAVMLPPLLRDAEALGPGGAASAHGSCTFLDDSWLKPDNSPSTTYRPPSTNAPGGDSRKPPRSPPETRSADSTKLGTAHSSRTAPLGLSTTSRPILVTLSTAN